VEGDLQRTFGRNLRAYREAKGWSQQRLADTFGHDDSYTGGIERGERNMSLKVVERLCAVIGVDPLKMLTPSDEGSPPEDPA
jgi:transcriptional regulator with XRE-family HTH domain